MDNRHTALVMPVLLNKQVFTQVSIIGALQLFFGYCLVIRTVQNGVDNGKKQLSITYLHRKVLLIYFSNHLIRVYIRKVLDGVDNSRGKHNDYIKHFTHFFLLIESPTIIVSVTKNIHAAKVQIQNA